jgi:hypothetical protein
MNKCAARAKRKRSLSFKQKQHNAVIEKRMQRQNVTPSNHARDRMAERRITFNEVSQTLAATRPTRTHNKALMYKHDSVAVVASKRSANDIVVISAWRYRNL